MDIRGSQLSSPTTGTRGQISTQLHYTVQYGLGMLLQTRRTSAEESDWSHTRLVASYYTSHPVPRNGILHISGCISLRARGRQCALPIDAGVVVGKWVNLALPRLQSARKFAAGLNSGQREANRTTRGA